MEVPQKPYANITKSFVHLAAQICFMKNCWNPSSMSAATEACTRHYHPTLSIWLSVDPMADKYPGVSPYVYCGNNPIRLVDPDGRDIDEWDFNIVTGQLTRVGDRGGKTTDYYNFKDMYGNTIGHAELPGGLHPEYCWETTMDEFSFRSSFNLIGSCAGYETPYIFYEQSFAQSPPPAPSLEAQIVGFANSLDRMVMGHYDNSGLEGHGDYWDRQFGERAKPYVTGAALLFSHVSFINSVKTVTTGRDIYDNKADGGDYTLGIIGTVLGTSNFYRNAPKFVKHLDVINTLFSFGYYEFKNHKNENKNGN